MRRINEVRSLGDRLIRFEPTTQFIGIEPLETENTGGIVAALSDLTVSPNLLIGLEFV
jgi:hypothetical protein